MLCARARIAPRDREHDDFRAEKKSPVKEMRIDITHVE